MQRKEVSLLTESPGIWEMELEESIVTSLFTPQTLSYPTTQPQLTTSLPPCPAYSPSAPILSRKSDIDSWEKHSQTSCLYDTGNSRIQGKSKQANQEQEKVHKDRGRTEGWEEVCWSHYLVINTELCNRYQLSCEIQMIIYIILW